MAIPSYQTFYAPILKTLSDGEVHSLKELKNNVICQLNLSDEDLEEMLPSVNNQHSITELVGQKPI